MAVSAVNWDMWTCWAVMLLMWLSRNTVTCNSKAWYALGSNLPAGLLHDVFHAWQENALLCRGNTLLSCEATCPPSAP